MNASFSAASFQARSAQVSAVSPSRPVSIAASHQRRERDFGVGYGRSSGYASQRSYVATSGQRLFRFA